MKLLGFALGLFTLLSVSARGALPLEIGDIVKVHDRLARVMQLGDDARVEVRFYDSGESLKTREVAPFPLSEAPFIRYAGGATNRYGDPISSFAWKRSLAADAIELHGEADAFGLDLVVAHDPVGFRGIYPTQSRDAVVTVTSYDPSTQIFSLKNQAMGSMEFVGKLPDTFLPEVASYGPYRKGSSVFDAAGPAMTALTIECISHSGRAVARATTGPSFAIELSEKTELDLGKKVERYLLSVAEKYAYFSVSVGDSTYNYSQNVLERKGRDYWAHPVERAFQSQDRSVLFLSYTPDGGPFVRVGADHEEQLMAAISQEQFELENGVRLRDFEASSATPAPSWLSNRREGKLFWTQNKQSGTYNLVVVDGFYKGGWVAVRFDYRGALVPKSSGIQLSKIGFSRPPAPIEEPPLTLVGCARTVAASVAALFAEM